MPARLPVSYAPLKCWLIACLLFIVIGPGCERDIVEPDPEVSAVSLSGAQDPAALADSDEAVPKKIILFATVVSAEDSSLVIEVPHPEPESKSVQILWWEVQPGLDMHNNTTTVFIGPDTYIQTQNSNLTRPGPGAEVVIAGTWLGNGIAAALISDYQLMEEAVYKSRPAPAQVEGSWRKVAPGRRPAWLDQMPEVNMRQMLREDVLGSSASSDVRTLDFPGKFGGPAWNWDSGDLDVIIPGFPVLGWTEIQNVGFIVGLGGANYNFPFSFEADAHRPLIVDSTRTVNITAMPEPPPPHTFSFYWAMGFDFYAEYEMCWLFGAVCDTYVWHLNIFSQVNTSRGAAPMPGEILNIEDWACPGFDIKIFSIGICQSMRIHGEHLYSSVGMRDSLYMPLEPGWRYWSTYFGSEGFEGDSHAFTVRPATNPLNVDMSAFHYGPELEIGYKGEVGLVGITIFETPVGWMYKDHLNFIPTDDAVCGTFNMLGTCGPQPKWATLTLPVVPVMTSITSPDSIYRFGDTITLHALVRGANGPGNSPKQVTFYNGGQFLATERINAQDVAPFQTSSLVPCKHAITAEFIGYDQQGNTHPTQKGIVLIVTGDAEWTRLEGYWQHQYKGNGRIDFGEDRLQCYLDIVNHMSHVFGEVWDISSFEKAHDALFLKQNAGSEVEQLDRDLLVAWLNFANGGILHTQLVDVDKDGLGDTPFIYVLMAAESVRRDPTATDQEIKEQANLLHRAVAQDAP